MVNEAKLTIVQELKERLENAKAIILVDYKGINIEEVDNLRAKMRNSDTDYFVSKNTFIRRALNELGINELDDALVGPTAVAVSKVDEVVPAREIAAFKKEMMGDKIFPSFKFGYIDGTVYDQDQLAELAKLPSKDELLAMMLRGFNSPITGFVYTLNGILSKFVYAIDAIAKEKGQN